MTFTPSKHAISLRRSDILLAKCFLFCSVSWFSLLRSICNHSSCLSKWCALLWAGVSLSSQFLCQGPERALTLQTEEEKSSWRGSYICKNLMGRNDDGGARLPSVMLADRTRGNRHRLENRKFHLNTRKIFVLLGFFRLVIAFGEFSWEAVEFGFHSKSDWTRSWTICSRWPHLSRGIGLDNPPASDVLWFCIYCGSLSSALQTSESSKSWWGFSHEMCCSASVILHFFPFYQKAQQFQAKGAVSQPRFGPALTSLLLHPAWVECTPISPWLHQAPSQHQTPAAGQDTAFTRLPHLLPLLPLSPGITL